MIPLCVICFGAGLATGGWLSAVWMVAILRAELRDEFGLPRSALKIRPSLRAVLIVAVVLVLIGVMVRACSVETPPVDLEQIKATWATNKSDGKPVVGEAGP